MRPATSAHADATIAKASAKTAMENTVAPLRVVLLRSI